MYAICSSDGTEKLRYSSSIEWQVAHPQFEKENFQMDLPEYISINRFQSYSVL